MTIAIGNDHAGYALKVKLLEMLKDKYEFTDYGCYSPERYDYPDAAEAVANAIVAGKHERGILICGSGIGISIAANKVPGIRCALCGDIYSAEMTRRHNNANVLAMGAHLTAPVLAKKILDVFLSTEFEGGRHQRRIDKIDHIND